jgi:hypothetical protein
MMNVQVKSKFLHEGEIQDLDEGFEREKYSLQTQRPKR